MTKPVDVRCYRKSIFAKWKELYLNIKVVLLLASNKRNISLDMTRYTHLSNLLQHLKILVAYQLWRIKLK